MALETLEERVISLEHKMAEFEERLDAKSQKEKKRGWRWFVGIEADNPLFENAVRAGEEWRNADRPAEKDAA